MSLECGDCERDMRGGVHDQICRYATHVNGDAGFGNVACGVDDPARRTDDWDKVTCLACIGNRPVKEPHDD